MPGQTTFRIKDGKINIEAEGFVGDACVKAAEPYLQRLGIEQDDDSTKQVLKPEFYQAAEAHQQIDQ